MRGHQQGYGDKGKDHLVSSHLIGKVEVATRQGSTGLDENRNELSKLTC